MQCTSNLGMRIDCKFIADHLPFRHKFDPYLPHKIALFLPDSRNRFTVFEKGGKIVLMGPKSIEEAYSAVEKLHGEIGYWAALMGHSMQNVQCNPTKIHNIVTSGDLGGSINLQRMAIDIEEAIYEVEQFPGLRYKGLIEGNSAVTTTIYNSGKFILVGAKNQTEIDKAYQQLLYITKPYVSHISHISLEEGNVTEWK